ncbi:LacI family transcriptional regulator, partial [bacterium]
VVAIADRLPGITGVLADWDGVGRIQARHLHAKGHRRVLYVPPDYPYPSALERQASFFEEAGRLEMEVLLGTPTAGYVAREKLDLAAHRRDERVLEHLDIPSRPSAILCWDDHAAYRLAKRLAAKGLRLPGDLAIMGCNGSVPHIEPEWNLTTVRAPWKALGETAIAALKARIDGAEFPQQTTLPVELVVGATV